jgi:hypothetical protein
MTSASVNDIRKELLHLDSDTLQALCLRLVKYKKENKELLGYLLFEAHDEPAYVQLVKEEIDKLFKELTNRNLYLLKKILRKILRFVNKQIKYSGIPQTELDLRIYFCQKIVKDKIPLDKGTQLYNLYQQQLKKIDAILTKLPEDEQGDYTRAIETISKNS